MNKVVTGVFTIASLFLLAGCGTNGSQSSSSTSSKASVKKTSKHSSSTKLSTKDREALDTAETDVDSLFSNSDHTKLLSSISKSLIDDTNKEVNKLVQSTSKSKLQNDIKVAYKLYPALASSKSSSKAKAKSESTADAASSSKASTKLHDTESSSTSQTTSKSAKYEKKLEKLGVGGAHATAVSYSHNTVTWTGYEAWGGYTQEQLTGNMNILETITERQAVVYKLTPKIIVKTPSGKQLAHKNVGDDMMWDIDE